MNVIFFGLVLFLFFETGIHAGLLTSANSIRESSRNMTGLSGILKCDVSSIGKLESISVTGCDSTPCTFEKGGKYSLFIELRPKGNSKYLTYNATASIFGFKLPLLRGNACDSLISHEKCPVKDGMKYTFKVDINLSKFVPSIQKLIVTASVSDEFQKVQACASLPVRVV